MALAFEFFDLRTQTDRSLAWCTATVRDDNERAMGFARADNVRTCGNAINATEAAWAATRIIR